MELVKEKRVRSLELCLVLEFHENEEGNEALIPFKGGDRDWTKPNVITHHNSPSSLLVGVAAMI